MLCTLHPSHSEYKDNNSQSSSQRKGPKSEIGGAASTEGSASVADNELFVPWRLRSGYGKSLDCAARRDWGCRIRISSNRLASIGGTLPCPNTHSAPSQLSPMSPSPLSTSQS